jgi:hypothetical protein
VYCYEVTATKAVANAAVGHDASCKPIIELNVYQETGDPALKWLTGDSLEAIKKTIVASGGTEWLELHNVPLHGYPVLYVKKSAVTVQHEGEC